MTSTTIERLPQNWNIWEGVESWPEWEEEVKQAFDDTLEKYFPKHISRVGNEIYGPATLKFGTCWDENKHCYRFQKDTPDIDEIPNAEKLNEEGWLQEILDEAYELASQRAMEEVKQ